MLRASLEHRRSCSPFQKNPSGIEILSSPVNKLVSFCMYKVEVMAVCTCSHDSVMQARFSAARTC